MDTEFAAGDRIGPYTLESRAGSGGFATVWRARRDGDGATVALKLFTGVQASHANAQLRADVELLAAAATSDSPHVVRVLDGGTDPTPYLVMEFVEGGDLRREMTTKGLLTQIEAVAACRAVADALAALHRLGIIHRDVKPANVLRDAAGTIKLGDFGIAKIVGYQTVTATNQLPLSVAYAAPEVWEGKPAIASDIYALGVMLYECLVGRPPFAGNAAEVYVQHRSGDPDLDALPPDTAPAVRGLLNRCLSKDANDRPAATEVRDTLATIEARLASAMPGAAAGEPTRFGPWHRIGMAASAWHFTCEHEQTNEGGLVEIHFSDDLTYGDRLRRAVEASPPLVALGAEPILGASRLLLRPGEAWASAPAAAFQFWVARAGTTADRATETMTPRALADLVPPTVCLAVALRDAGLRAAPSQFIVDDAGTLHIARPGLPTMGETDPGEAALAFLRGLPLDSAARKQLSDVRDFDMLRAFAGIGGTTATVPGFAGTPSGRTPPPAADDPTTPLGGRGGSDEPPRLAATGAGGRSGSRKPLVLAAGAAVAILAVVALFVYWRSRGDNPVEIGPVEQTVTASATTPTRAFTVTQTPTPARTGTVTPSSTPTFGPSPGPSTDIDMLNVINLPAPSAIIPNRSEFQIDVAPSTDYRWKFDATREDLMEIRVERADTANLQSEIEITDSTGARIDGGLVSDANKVGYVQWSGIASRTDTYGLRIRARSGSGTATVRFRLNPYQDLPPGVSIERTIGLRGEVDRYQFEAAAANLVEIRMVRTTDNKVQSQLELVDQFGDRVEGAFVSDVNKVGFASWWGFVRSDGTYTLRASARNGETGKYSIEVLVNPEIDLALGQPAKGELTKPAQRDRYEFECTPGQLLSISVSPDPEDKLHPAFSIYDIGYAEVSKASQSEDAKPAQGQHKCLLEGTYRVSVQARNPLETGGYTLLIQ